MLQSKVRDEAAGLMAWLAEEAAVIEEADPSCSENEKTIRERMATLKVQQ